MRYYWIWCVLFSIVIANEPQWRWQCVDKNCQKQRVQPHSKHPVTSLGECQLLCNEYGSLWPKPTGIVSIGGNLVLLDPSNIDVSSGRSENVINSLIPAGIRNFVDRVRAHTKVRSINAKGKKLAVTLNIKNSEVNQLALNIDEGYTLKISTTEDGVINATIASDNYFGSRHGLETLGQLIVYDEIFNELRIPIEAHITDKPVYTYRGVLLDTSRNFISKESIKRTIEGLSASKLNTFHWHITDTHSFPYVSRSHPELSQLGAYAPNQVYTPEDVEEIIQFGQERGVRILPEFDAPAHVGEGWQETDFLVCFKQQPWEQYCVEPPCGQFDPTKDKLYDYLEDIYGDLLRQFNPDVFHMGGDEVSFTCWNTSKEITHWMHKRGWGNTEHDFVKLWDVFQTRALERLDKRAGQKLPVILWSTTLTNREYVKDYLPKDRYIIQVWTRGDDQHVQDLLELGYNIILSNYDALYLDCGFSAWVTNGPSWCSPYKSWHVLYENSPAKIGGVYKNQILGGVAALWTEMVDDMSVDNRIWPRAAAMAERLWSEPATSWREAEPRMLVQRERLVNRGIRADALEPKWCMQNEQSCPLDKTPR